MKGNLPLAMVAGLLALAPAAVLAAAADIAVYQWTDARGTTHFSDAPRKDGPATRILLATPPPPDRSAQAANRAWLAELDRDSEARLAREAAQRLAETQREAAVAEAQSSQAVAAQPVQYLPVIYSARRHFAHRARRVHRGPWRFSAGTVASFPHTALPSSFPPGLPSSFPGYLPSSFPETQNSPFRPTPPR